MLRHLTFLGCLSLSLLAVPGCGGGGSASSYHPTGASAKDALTTALEAWKSGREKPGAIESAKPVLQVQDEGWNSGRKLKEFQIGEEKAVSGEPTRFKVQLTFDGGDPAGEEVEYVVFGKDPLYVYRDKDYQRLIGQ